MNKLATLLLILSLSLIPQDLTTLAQNECVIDNCTAATKDKILDGYPPNIPLMHKISLLGGQITPDVHYIDKNRKESIFIFQNRFKDFKDLLYKTLETKLDKNFLCSVDKDDFWKMISFSLWGNMKVMNSCFKSRFDGEIKKMMELNTIFGRKFIHDRKKTCGLSVKIGKNPEYNTVDMDPLNFLFNPEKEIYFCLKDKYNVETMKEIDSIIKSNNTVKSKISDLNNLVDKKYKEYEKFKNRDTTYDTISFCFHLNGINDYLLNFENDLENKDLDVCKEIRKLREKINSLIPKYCFLAERQKSPFSNIDVKLDKYNVVEDTKGVKSIYLEKYQIQEYIKDLIKSIDSKYTNLRGDYNFDLVKGENVLKLASEIHATKHQEVLNAMENSLEKSEADIDRKKVNMFVAAGRAALTANFGPDGILTLRTDKENRKFDTIKFTTEEAFNYLAKNRPELLKDSKKLPTRVIEKQPKKEESEETAIQKRSNEQALENYVKINNLGESVLNDLDSLFKDFIDYSVMNAELARNKRTFEAYKNKTKDDISLLDTVKLLIQFSRDDYSSNDLEAIIIEENKKYSTDDASTEKLTEYSIKKIQRMDNK